MSVSNKYQNKSNAENLYTVASGVQKEAYIPVPLREDNLFAVWEQCVRSLVESPTSHHTMDNNIMFTIAI